MNRRTAQTTLCIALALTGAAAHAADPAGTIKICRPAGQHGSAGDHQDVVIPAGTGFRDSGPAGAGPQTGDSGGTVILTVTQALTLEDWQTCTAALATESMADGGAVLAPSRGRLYRFSGGAGAAPDLAELSAVPISPFR